MKKIKEILICFLTLALHSFYIIIGIIFPIYAVFKDIQNDKVMWAIGDFILFFPVGTIRGLMYFAGTFIRSLYG
ncbi:hypothetical protein FHQ28_11375 [Pasteurellaceae bacterium USgator11]|nr:hypothetical protein FHQ19_02590 [Pasteurellaceae bacterium UScroc12]TNG98975.1 hypothetical protein FHQ28_11375 [Pasteurellaceae bacterium USgator11]